MSIKAIIFIMLILIMYLICIIFQVDVLTIMLQVFLVIVIYFYIDRFFATKNSQKVLEKKIVVANRIIAENIDLCLIISGNDDEVLWANEEAYNEFPILLENRELDAINLHEMDNEGRIFYDHKIYDVSVSDGIYTLRNITKSTREIRNLKENITNIAYLQIDNYKYLSDSLDAIDFLKISKDLKLDIAHLFEVKGIYFSQISSEKYLLLLPSSTLYTLNKNGFTELNDIFRKYQQDNLAVTYSLGASNSFNNQNDTGKRAQAALELAITRGGGQTVIHIDTERKFFGSGTNLKANTRMKARIINTTLTNILRRRNTVYIITHKNPDADALASMLLLSYLIKEKVDIEVKLVVDENIMPELRYVLDMENFVFSTVVDATKNNILIVVDTQSSKIVSHPNLVETINDKIIFDHHQTPIENIENPIFSWIEPGLSSTVEIISELLIISDVKINDKVLSTLAILGVLIDTNNLKYRVDEATLDVLSYHVRNNGNIQDAREMTYLDENEFRIKNDILRKSIIVETIIYVICENILDEKMLAICVDSLVEIKNMKAAFIVNRLNNIIQVKMRSKDGINSKQILEEFGGGGHATQAAGTFPIKYEEKIIERILEEK